LLHPKSCAAQSHCSYLISVQHNWILMLHSLLGVFPAKNKQRNWCLPAFAFNLQLKAFQDSVEARGRRVGKQAVADRKDRIEREERLIKQFECQKEEEWVACMTNCCLKAWIIRGFSWPVSLLVKTTNRQHDVMNCY
jgi:hypothetical protein